MYTFLRLLLLPLVLLANVVHAQSPTYVIDQVYSNADGSVQFVVLRESTGQSGQHLFSGRQLTVSGRHGTRSFTFPRELPSTATANTRILVASVGFQSLGLIAPDYVFPDRFLPVDGASLTFAGGDSVHYASLPLNGIDAFYRGGSVAANFATNLAGRSASVPARPVTVVEFHNASLDHYFVSPLAPDIEALDSGRLPGWSRTGRTFAAWPSAVAAPASAGPVCRFYIPPQKGDSHFFSASQAECDDVERRIGSDPNYAGFVLETRNAFTIGLPDLVTGNCAGGTTPVYRLWNRRADSNHRYTIERSVRDEMVARGYVAEGFGPDPVAMCAPFVGTDSARKVSDTSPYPANCSAINGTLYLHAEVEPYVALNPMDPNNLVGVWQQDRWSNGAAQGTLTGFSLDGGRTWEKRIVPFSRCAGGHASNGGDYERATDPWVTFSPNGVAHQIALGTSGSTFQSSSTSAMLVSRSSDGGRNWSSIITLIRDAGADFFNDKESIAADPTDSRYVFASWDRLARGGGGPAYFARTTDGGMTWEPARPIFDPGTSAQTINNIPIVLPTDGTLLNFFTRIDFVNNRNVSTLSIMRSTDKGATWSAPITIDAQQSIGTTDPENGTPVRDGALIASIAVSRTGQLALVWQDSRFSNGARDAIAFSRSLDGGRTWSTAVRVNRDPLVQAFIPTVAFRDDGTIGVTYYDFRSNTADASLLETDYWLAQSSDGVTWRESRVAGPFDLSIAAFARGLFIGDYMSLVTRGSEFIPFFGVTNNGNVANRSDIAIAFMTSPGFAVGASSYRTEAVKSMVAGDTVATKIDKAIRDAMQRRVPGWQSPARVTPQP
ncbi:MAG TPA: sialidase family protein [Casimicrobiaceae bacterium]|nr:sialidase family protein [Casimicrobiaceae bacterium]